MTGLLALEAVTAGYHGQPVLRNVSLDVPEGATVGIIGPNGHGKTTLLNCISGLVPLMAGNIVFDSRAIAGLLANRVVERGIVHVPQGDRIFPEMSVRDNLVMGAYLPKAYKKLAERLLMVFEIFPTLKERQGQIASTLSGGERRMLGIGRGLMAESRILLIDEPSLGLAPIAVDLIYKVLRRLKAEGRTILIVEENMSRIMDFADHIYLIDHGEIVWSGKPDELQKRTEVLATYLGA
ncbi:MAG: ABC transporter ATP-binding protein [Alphaproteobacteria bacterium]|nr:ABC transporter ATP-binding protein [Alphaproteobacteria bacterium]